MYGLAYTLISNSEGESLPTHRDRGEIIKLCVESLIKEEGLPLMELSSSGSSRPASASGQVWGVAAGGLWGAAVVPSDTAACSMCGPNAVSRHSVLMRTNVIHL